MGLIARFLDREDIENCLLTCRDICEAFRSAKSRIAADFPEKRRRDLDRFSSFDVVWDRWSPLVALCLPPVQSVEPRTVHVSDRLIGSQAAYEPSHFSGMSVIDSIKVRGTFRQINVEVAGVVVLWVGMELVDVAEPDEDGFVEIFAHFLDGMYTRDRSVRLLCCDCDLQLKITVATARDHAVNAWTSRRVMRPLASWTVEASGRDTVNLPIHGAKFNAVGIAFVVESRTSNSVRSLALRFVDHDGKETRREIRGSHLHATEFAACHGTVALCRGCHFVPLRNLYASHVKELTLTVHFRIISDFTLKWVYFGENVWINAAAFLSN